MGAVAVAGFSFSTNVVGTYNVLQSAAADGVNRLEFPPSHQVCGDPYGIHRSKACQKRQAKSPVKSIAAVAQQWLEAVVLRLANRLRTGRSGPCDPLFSAAARAAY